MVSPTLEQSAVWETWRRNPREQTYCKPQYAWSELNVDRVLFYELNGKNSYTKNVLQWSQDHSKLGIGMIQAKQVKVDCKKSKVKCEQINMDQQKTMVTQITPKSFVVPTNVLDDDDDDHDKRQDFLPQSNTSRLVQQQTSKTNYWVCVGDINRMTSQMRRGGGTACFINYQLWHLLNDSFLTVENCPT